MTHPNPQSITRFASAAREGIDALARQLVQSDADSPPALNAGSLAQLAEAAESLSLRPFAESLLATQLTIESIAAAGLSADAAAAELFADLLLQLQLATDELEAGNTLASMSDDLLDQVRELIAATDALQPVLPAAESPDFEPAPPADATAGYQAEAPAEPETRIVESIKYQPRNAGIPQTDAILNQAAAAQSDEQSAAAGGAFTVDDVTATNGATDVRESDELQTDSTAADLPVEATFDTAEAPDLVQYSNVPLARAQPIRYQPRSECAHNASAEAEPAGANESDRLGSSVEDTLSGEADQSINQSQSGTSPASDPQAAGDGRSVLNRQPAQADQVDHVDHAEQAEQGETDSQGERVENAEPLPRNNALAPQDFQPVPEPAPWPALNFIPETSPGASTADSGEATELNGAIPLNAEDAFLPSESPVIEAAALESPAAGTIAGETEPTVSGTPSAPLVQDEDPWADASMPPLADANNAATEATSIPDEAAEAVFDAAVVPAVSGDASVEASIPEPQFAATEQVAVPADAEIATETAAASQPIDADMAPQVSAESSMEGSESGQCTESFTPSQDIAAAPSMEEAPQEAVQTSMASADASTPLAVDVTAPAATAAVVASSNEPIDTNWQQTDEDLTNAAGSMGIGFTADGSSPMPESVDLDALNDRISELLRSAPAVTPGELTPVASMSDPVSLSDLVSMSDPVAMASAARNSLAELPAASPAEAPCAGATTESESTSEVTTPAGSLDTAAPVVAGSPGTPPPPSSVESAEQNAGDPTGGPTRGPTRGPSPEATSDSRLEASGADDAENQQCTANPAEATLEVGGPAELTPEQMAALMAGGDDFDSGMPASEWGSFPISFTPEKTESLQFMVADAKAGIEQLAGAITQLTNFGSRDEAAASITDISAALNKISDAFNFTSLKIVVGLIHEVAKRSAQVSDALMPEVLVRARAIHSLIEQHIRGLECGMEVKWSLDTLVTRTKRLLADKPLHPSVRGWHQGDIYRLLELDLVNESFDSPPRPDSEDQFVDDGSVWIPQAAATDSASTDQGGEAEKKQETEQIIRVAATTIDSMLDLISQLVLTKNRVFNLSRTMRLPGSQEARFDELTTAADELSTLTGNLQMTMMQARMQPITKLFERYNRVVGDLAGLADKKVNLVVGGQAAMIDKNLFDGLAEAMSQLLRSIVTKQVRVPADRTAQSKPEAATISLDAESQGAQIIISIEHDGDLPDHAAIAATAVEKNVCDAEALDSLSDNELFLLAFKPEFGDPQLSKAGTLITELGGKLGIRVTTDGLTRIEIALPLSVAIVPAILVGIGTESYAIPLQSVEEIIRCSDFQASTVHGKPVIRLRDALLDVVSATSIIGEPPAPRVSSSEGEVAAGTEVSRQSESSEAPDQSAFVETSAQATPPDASSGGLDAAEFTPKSQSKTEVKSESNAFGLVLSAGFTRAVLTVDRIIGKQEIVIKKLEGPIANIRCFAGATIRNDGTISLIFDVAELLKAAS